MKKEKMSINQMKNVLSHVLSRDEMKEVMAGSGGGGSWCGFCYASDGMGGTVQGSCFTSTSNYNICTCEFAAPHACGF